jgi:hypothetical protein
VAARLANALLAVERLPIGGVDNSCPAPIGAPCRQLATPFDRDIDGDRRVRMPASPQWATVLAGGQRDWLGALSWRGPGAWPRPCGTKQALPPKPRPAQRVAEPPRRGAPPRPSRPRALGVRPWSAATAPSNSPGQPTGGGQNPCLQANPDAVYRQGSTPVVPAGWARRLWKDARNEAAGLMRGTSRLRITRLSVYILSL